MSLKASVARKAKKYDEAEGWYRKAIDSYPHKQRKSNTYMHLANMLSEREPLDVERTAAAYENAAALTDDSIVILNDAAVFIMGNTERYDRAIAILEKALRVSAYPLGRQNLGLAQFYKWGHATLHPEAYRDAKERPWDPDRITALTGVSKEFAFATNPSVRGRPYATLAMLKLDMVKDVDVFPENCECPENALIASAHGQHLDVLKLLVAKGANVNAVDRKYGSTALLYAVRYQNIEMVRYLLDSGARVNLRDKHGILLVEYAIADAKPDDARVLKMLLEAGGDASATGRGGGPLVAAAVMHGKPAALKLLLGDYKADPNARVAGESGEPILARAALNTHADGTKLVAILLGAGANPWVRAGGVDLVNALKNSKEPYAGAESAPEPIRSAQLAMLKATDANIALLQQARSKVPRPASY
jgi:tetratricopeptide (TPR) repeat protein